VIDDKENVVYKKFEKLAIFLAIQLWEKWRDQANIRRTMDRQDVEQMALLELLEMAPRVDPSRKGAPSYVGRHIYRRLLEKLEHAKKHTGVSLDDNYDVPDKQAEVDIDFEWLMYGISGVESRLFDMLIQGRSREQVCKALGWKASRYEMEMIRLRSRLSALRNSGETK